MTVEVVVWGILERGIKNIYFSLTSCACRNPHHLSCSFYIRLGPSFGPVHIQAYCTHASS